MPKRIVDGEGIWRSDTLNKVEPLPFRAEYANLIPLAAANGVFEADPRLVWSRVYSYNRPQVSVTRTSRILDEFERVGLLIRWKDEKGKLWGYWVGIHKPGRLPRQSWQDRDREKGVLPPDPPKQLLDSIGVSNTHSGRAPDTDEACQEHGDGVLGSGLGFGSGLGSGGGVGFTGKHLRLTAEQCAKLRTTFPQVDLPKAFKQMDTWLDASGKRRKNHYLFALNWLKREKNPQSPKASSLKKAPRKQAGKSLEV